jgi:ABC-type transport system substrate-binding protein
MHQHRRRIRLHHLALITALLLVPVTAHGATVDAGTAPAAARTSDAGPATAVTVTPTAPVVVDPAAGTVTPTAGTAAGSAAADPSSTAKQVVRDVRGGNWRLAAAGVLLLLMTAGVRWGGKLFGKSDRGKAIAVMVLSLLAALGTSLGTSMPLDYKLISGAVGVAWLAVGGRQWLSRFLWPRDSSGRPWLTWLKPWLGADQVPPP